MRNAASKITLLSSVNDQILAAATGGAFTLTVDVTANDPNDVLYVSAQLVQLKYTTDVGPTDLVVTW